MASDGIGIRQSNYSQAMPWWHSLDQKGANERRFLPPPQQGLTVLGCNIATHQGRGRVHCHGHVYSLVVQYNIWSPNVIGRHMQLFHSTILLGLPNQLVVVPKLKLYKYSILITESMYVCVCKS